MDKPNKVKTAVEWSGHGMGSHIDVGLLRQATGAKEPPYAYVSTDSIAPVKNDQGQTHGQDNQEAIMQAVTALWYTEHHEVTERQKT